MNKNCYDMDTVTKNTMSDASLRRRALRAAAALRAKALGPGVPRGCGRFMRRMLSGIPEEVYRRTVVASPGGHLTRVRTSVSRDCTVNRRDDRGRTTVPVDSLPAQQRRDLMLAVAAYVELNTEPEEEKVKKIHTKI